MEVPEKTVEALKEKGIRAEVYDTRGAIRRLNELAKKSENVAGALHLIC